MFYPERISLIHETDRVLEIGPGGSPFHRSDIFLERSFDDKTALMQRGYATELNTRKKVVFYDGKRFPFDDDSFDYVVCSHVIEHVEDVDFFCSEMFRVAKRGYLEYPTIYYEYLYNFTVHTQLLSFNKGELVYLPKAETCLELFQSVHALFRRSLELGYSEIIGDMECFMFEGFEWSAPFKVRKALAINELTKTSLSELQSQPKILRLLRRCFQKLTKLLSRLLK